MSRRLKLGGACLNQIPLDWSHNMTNIARALKEGRDQSIDILCLPELCLTGYGCEDMFLSDWIYHTSLEKLRSIIPLSKDLITTIGLPILYEGHRYNCIAILEDTRLKGIYAKHNLANDGVHYEPRWFDSWPYEKVEDFDFYGEKVPIGAIWLDLKGIRTGFEICEDAWRKDRPACNLVQNRIELILNPSASHFAFGKEEYRENLVVKSSDEFNCFYLYTNLLGNESGRMIYDGDILMASHGKLIGHNRRLSFQDHNILSLDYDFDDHSYCENLRPDWNDKFEEFGQVLPLALFDYMRKSKSRGFTLSLSGGADSSTIAIMVYRMVQLGIMELGIGKFNEKLSIDPSLNTAEKILGEIFYTAYQGTVNSSEETREAASQLAKYIHSTHFDWNIDDEVKSYTEKIEKNLSRQLTWESDDIALQNIQARARSPIIWMLSNIKNTLLLTTSNRSEGDVGYTTMDGDTSGSISPIAAVDKHFILQWLKYAEITLGHSGLKNVNKLQPTAELRPLNQKQTDEDDLMPYEVLVSIEREAIRNKKSPGEILEILTKDHERELAKGWIRKFFSLWSKNQWKRERIAPSFHLDDFNVDPRTWCRFPILSGGFSEELENL